MACKKKSNCEKKKLTSTEFIVHAPNADSVFITGDFNDWNPTEYSMRKYKSGKCSKKLKLKPGRYEYQFVVDGSRWTDPENAARCESPFGSQNSVIEISDKVYSN